jgi:DNA-binding transcriptional LysR family regulator
MRRALYNCGNVRQKVAVPPGHRAMLAFGGELSLWDPWLLKWMRRSAPDLALRAQVDVPESLMTQVAEGVLDIAVMYAPQHRPGLKIELLCICAHHMRSATNGWLRVLRIFLNRLRRCLATSLSGSARTAANRSRLAH